MKLKCNLCGKQFPANYALHMHKLTHTPKLMLVDNKTHKVGKRKRDDDDELPNAKRYQNDEYDSD